MSGSKTPTNPGFAENKVPFDAQSAADNEIPDLSTPYWLERFAKEKVQHGRPKALNPKLQVTLRLDADVVEAFKAEGRRWQTRINAALRKAAGL